MEFRSRYSYHTYEILTASTRSGSWKTFLEFPISTYFNTAGKVEAKERTGLSQKAWHLPLCSSVTLDNIIISSFEKGDNFLLF